MNLFNNFLLNFIDSFLLERRKEENLSIYLPLLLKEYFVDFVSPGYTQCIKWGIHLYGFIVTLCQMAPRSTPHPSPVCIDRGGVGGEEDGTQLDPAGYISQPPVTTGFLQGSANRRP